MKPLYQKNRQCTPFSKCNKFKQCDYCAKIRQSQTADIVELASRFSPNANYTVVMPLGEQNNHRIINLIKSNITRKLRKSTNGGMISVETTANNALHLNIITTANEKLSSNIFQKAFKNLGVEGNIFSEQISKNDIRKVSAYSIKRQNIPTTQEYSGNTLNFMGDMKTVKQIMQSKKMMNYCPEVAMVSMLDTFERLNIKHHKLPIGITKNKDEAINRILHLAEQVDKLGACWHPEYGIISKDNFPEYYEQAIITI